MTAKRIILICVLSLVAAGIGTIIVFIAAAAAGYRYPEVNLEDELNIYSNHLCYRLLEKTGFRVRTAFFPFNREETRLIVIIADPDGNWYLEWVDWLAEGRRLIILMSQEGDGGETLPATGASRFLEGVSSLCASAGAVIPPGAIAGEDDSREIILEKADGAFAVREKWNGGEVILIADSRLITDARIIREDNAVFFINCLKDFYPGPVVFDYSHAYTHAAASRSGWDTDAEDGQADRQTPFIFQGLFLALFLQLVVLTAVFFLVFWKRFGPVLDTAQFARRSLLVHLGAVGAFFEKSRDTAAVTDILDRHFFARLREQIRFSSGRDADLAAEVQRRIRLEPDEAPAFATNARTRIIEQDDLREHIIQRLKGVEETPWKRQRPRGNS